MSHNVLFSLNCHIWSHLVLFCPFKSHFSLDMCYLWYLFSWSIIHRIDEVGQNCQYPQPVAPRDIPARNDTSHNCIKSTSIFDPMILSCKHNFPTKVIVLIVTSRLVNFGIHFIFNYKNYSNQAQNLKTYLHHNCLLFFHILCPWAFYFDFDCSKMNAILDPVWLINT